MIRRYVNPGPHDLQQALNSEIFVDKTGILAEFNQLIGTNDNYVAMSRPRRFGKSYVGRMMCAYYCCAQDTRSMFDGLEISRAASFEEHLNKYNVIILDLNEFFRKYSQKPEKTLSAAFKAIIKELKACVPDADIDDDMPLADAIFSAYSVTERKFVFFIDEYDVIFRESTSQKLYAEYLDFLSSLFKSLSMRQCFAFVLLTGILPIIKEKAQSKLNEFREVTFLRSGKLAKYMGFTEEECRALCERYGMDMSECVSWYDGYKLDEGVSVLAPMSVVQAMRNGDYAPYWASTSSYEVVLDVVSLGLPMVKEKVLQLLAGESVPVNILLYNNTMTDFHTADDVLTYCIHLGYLGYDQAEKTCFIPNNEVRREWQSVVTRMDDMSYLVRMLEDSRALLRSTIARDEQAVAEYLDRAHDTVPAQKYSNEAALQMAIGQAYYYAQGSYTLFRELPTGKGFADLAFLPRIPSPDRPALVVELKADGTTAQGAIDQILARQYGSNLLHYMGNMLLVGVTYNKDTRKHQCKIVPFEVK